MISSIRSLGINNVSVDVIHDSADEFLSRALKERSKQGEHDAFFVCDVDDIIHKYRAWQTLLPEVVPHYAVKANDDSVVLGVLAKLGSGFDCASEVEIRKVLDLGVSPTRIIFAHPCKPTSHIRFAVENGVDLMTFDSEGELHKVKSVHPDAQMILRIVPPDTTKTVSAGEANKFGCKLKDAGRLLKVAKELQINVVGVSFYLGHLCSDVAAWKVAVEAASDVFNLAEQENFFFKMLDIGGSFNGCKNPKPPLDEVATVLRQTFDQCFSNRAGLRIVAEPGHYFIASAFTLATNVTSVVVADEEVTGVEENGVENGECQRNGPMYHYHLNDGRFGSFSMLALGNITRNPKLANPAKGHDEPTYNSTLWGPTCCGLDRLLETWFLPRLNVGDWLLFENMGAYTMVSATEFCGQQLPKRFYVVSKVTAKQLTDV